MKNNEDKENEDIEYQKKFKELYISISKCLKGKFFKNGEDSEYYELLGSVLCQMCIKNYIIAGMDLFEFEGFFNSMKNNFEHMYNEYHQRDQPLFSEGLRKAMEPFKEQNVDDCIRDPNFYKALFKFAGNTDAEADKIMSEIEKKIKK